MKEKIMLLIFLSSLILGCRSKHKITTSYKEDKKETVKIKADSLSIQSLKLVQNSSADVLLNEKKDETSGEVLIKGKSDVSNPFVFHNVIGKDTIQSISIIGNAEYLINNHYAKADHHQSDVKKIESVNSIQDVTQNVISKETDKEISSAISQDTKKIRSNGFQAGALIVIVLGAIILILVFFIFKRFIE
ncbi:MAG: hypothetical protein DI622_15090 [Chryseobacterium sp.]|uniref:hypothetical protein n=1 Tax=Chryseobacterium sp. Y16C TaxID=2920939 RepID=UPI000DB80126|nr:hypothetical protein [Chryseobacterium sp. Y16C]PZU12543.1 MAG: hypothetical protein DI622_15090 [Chryseobacterium sp.]UMQ43419.1 hypothetical protein MKS83_06900 [Chryseobacterium sp. Y16C]